MKGGKFYEALSSRQNSGRLVANPSSQPYFTRIHRLPNSKPIELMQRIIEASCPPDGVVADIFGGGGSFLVAAAGLRVRRGTKFVSDGSGSFIEKSKFDYEPSGNLGAGLVAINPASPLPSRLIASQKLWRRESNAFPVPDFTVEHWGIYEAPKLEKFKPTDFREFVVKAFGGRPESVSPTIHGVRYGVPLFVGEPQRGCASAKMKSRSLPNGL